MTLDDQRREFLAALARDRFFGRAAMIPQLLLLAAAIVGAMGAAGYGLDVSAAALRERGDGGAIGAAKPAALGGGVCGLLAWAVPRLLGRLDALGRQLLSAERRFTAFAARARGATKIEEFRRMIAEYEPP